MGDGDGESGGNGGRVRYRDGRRRAVEARRGGGVEDEERGVGESIWRQKGVKWRERDGELGSRIRVRLRERDTERGQRGRKPEEREWETEGGETESGGIRRRVRCRDGRRGRREGGRRRAGETEGG